jgi:hypothetical protein
MFQNIYLTAILLLLRGDFTTSFTATTNLHVHHGTTRPGSCSTTTITRTRTTSLQASALILQNKGGGHGELGYHIAKKLLSVKDNKIDSITIVQDDSCKDAQEPFKSYSTDLPTVNVIKAKLSDETMTSTDLQTLVGEGAKFDYVWDNVSKEPLGAGMACVDCAKAWNVELYVYVSSAGVYQPTADTVYPMPETTPVKASAGQIEFENYATEQGLPFVAFRPQYIYGEKANKFDYLYVRQLYLRVAIISRGIGMLSNVAYNHLIHYFEIVVITFSIVLCGSYQYQFQAMVHNWFH